MAPSQGKTFLDLSFLATPLFILENCTCGKLIFKTTIHLFTPHYLKKIAAILSYYLRLFRKKTQNYS